MPNILRPNILAETVKLNSLKKKQSAQKAANADKSKSEHRKGKRTSEGHRNILCEDHVDIDVDDPPISLTPDPEILPASSANYGTLATTSTNLFQQEPDFKSDNMDVSTDQETPMASVERNHSKVNQAFTNDLI